MINSPIGNAHAVVSVANESQPRFVSVKDLGTRYGLTAAAIYGFIKADPTFPYSNGGVKKKFLIEVEKFEIWLRQRTDKEKRSHFSIPSEMDLIAAFRSKTRGGIV